MVRSPAVPPRSACSRCGSPARADRRVRGATGPGARRPGRRPLHPRHAQADQPRGAGPHPAPRRRGAGARRRRQRGRQHPRPRRPAAAGRLRRRRRAGRALLERSPARGIPIDGILVRRGYRTACKTRILAGARHAIKQQVVRFDIEDPLPLDRRRARPTSSAGWSIARPALPRVRALRLRATAPSTRRWRAARRRRASGLVRIADSRYRLGELARPRRRHPQRGGARGARRRGRARSSTRGDRLRERLRGALPPAHPRQPRHDPVRRRAGGRASPCTAPTRWPTSPAPATP